MLDYAIGVPGELLADYILECGPLPPDSAKTFFWQLVDALSYLHGHVSSCPAEHGSISDLHLGSAACICQ